jgi:hypothetical protein
MDFQLFTGTTKMPLPARHHAFIEFLRSLIGYRVEVAVALSPTLYGLKFEISAADVWDD